jgi:hypothetical protein
MRKSYIANETEAALLHSGQQTAIIVPMKVQPKHQHFIISLIKIILPLKLMVV